MKLEQQQILDSYLGECYEFRHNILSDKYEFRFRQQEESPFRPVTREAINSIALSIKREGFELQNTRSAIEEYIFSDDTPQFNPIVEYLGSLPAWDGNDRVSELWKRIPGMSDKLLDWCHRWHLSMVAHWLNMDPLHANEVAITLIGAQGGGKSTFCARLLPSKMREYYLDHINLANKFDKEALTGNLLVNLDELDQIKPGQQAQLKQTLSKIQVNGRPIYGRAQQNRTRFASFISTTNNRQPLSDVTGSRRFPCIEIPEGQYIDNDSPIDHDQIYAQLLHELHEEKRRYWFSNEEVLQIEAHNEPYRRSSDLEALVRLCFRKPQKNEVVQPLTTRNVMDVITAQCDGIAHSLGNEVKLGKLLDFKFKMTNQGTAYYLVPRSAA